MQDLITRRLTDHLWRVMPAKAEDITDASESHPVQLTVLEEIDAGQYSRVTVEKGAGGSDYDRRSYSERL